ncbi:hypothetical protein RRG08_040082 [Elysia crispata]|uniref:Uncharacterized protein n=1 Tax=Elysia crispata TaxID=231223 RepID=A0AAE1CND7_9GAST|nr:hypothetical protein RRG08_040082 [Elysia crispata]
MQKVVKSRVICPYRPAPGVERWQMTHLKRIWAIKSSGRTPSCRISLSFRQYETRVGNQGPLSSGHIREDPCPVPLSISGGQ